jgi:nucleotide-binding universal stress UspA family protein
MSELGTVVVGYLPTPEGIAALDQAKQWALSGGARLVVVNTGRNGDYAHPNFAPAQDLDAIDQELSTAGLSHDVVQPTDGRTAAEAILGAATEHDAGLIVIGLRRRTSVGKMIAGSTAVQILFDAPCPVLSVKA